MPRETYLEVTPETKAALSDHVKAVAAEWQKSDTYVYAILSGQSSDPFAKFRKLFRAVARKNREGAKGYVAALNRILVEETPDKRPATEHALASAYHNYMAVRANREDGRATREELEEAKNLLTEALARDGMPAHLAGQEMKV